MFENLKDAPYGVVVEAVYQAMRRLHHRAPHQDHNDGLPEDAPDTPKVRALRAVLHEIREAEGKPISQLSDEAASRYTHALSDVLDSFNPPMTPALKRRALATLAEMRRKYGGMQTA
jgi:hypothetical protein